ncbi:MAG: TlpA disulfide reductase family protein [Ilumatobacteraceae bacterium]
MPTNRRLLITSLIWALILSVVIGWWWSAQSTPSVDAVLTSPGIVPYPTIGTNDEVTGQLLPVSQIVSLTGTTMSTIDLIGKPLLINFWFSTCEPCRREMPVLAAAHRKYGDSIRFVGINMNDSASVAKSFALKWGVTYELFIEPSGGLVTALGIATAPFTIFVDGDGRIVNQYAGELTTATLEAIISEAFPA